MVPFPIAGASAIPIHAGAALELCYEHIYPPGRISYHIIWPYISCHVSDHIRPRVANQFKSEIEDVDGLDGLDGLDGGWCSS